MTSSRKILLVFSIILIPLSFGVFNAVKNNNQPVPPPAVPLHMPYPRLEAFEAIWETINQRHVFVETVEPGWEEIYARFQERVIKAETQQEFEEIIWEMLLLFPEDTVDWITRENRISNETFLPPGETIEGVGIFISYRESPSPHLVILEVLPDSPAQAAGLQDHDSIYAIDGSPVTAEEGLQAIERIRGIVGTSVSLQISTPSGEVREVELLRESVDLLSTRRFVGNFVLGTSYLYIRFPRLGYDGLDHDFVTALQMFSFQQPVSALILDMRIATSGQGWPVEGLLQAFTDGEAGSVYTLESENTIMVEGLNWMDSQNLPIIILIGPDLQGRPEVFAAALQSTNRAVVIGTQSAGDVEGFDSYPMPDGSTLYIATSSYQDQTGIDIGFYGLQPDWTIDSYWDEFNNQNDPALLAAIELLVSTLP